MDTTPQTGQHSTLSGKVTDPDGTIQPGLSVSLHQTNPSRLVAQTTVNAAGRYEFGDLAPGIYTLRVAPGTEQASERHDIDISGAADEVQNITLPQATGLRYRVTGKRLLAPAETGNSNHISGQVLDADGKPLDDVTVRMSWTGAAPDMKFPTVQSGQSPFKARGYFEFIHTPGVFSVEVVDPAHESEVADNLITADMPQRPRPISYEVTFQLMTAARPALTRSVIAGRIPGGPLNGAVTLSGGGGEPQARRLDQQRTFRFDGLSAGIYQVSLEGVGVIAEELILNGTDEASVDFPMQGQISGRVLPANAGEKVMLTCQEYSIRKVAVTGADGVYRFAGLPADSYTLALEASDLPAQKISLDGRRLTEGPVFERHSTPAPEPLPVVPPPPVTPPPVIPPPPADSPPPAGTKALRHYMLLDNSDPATTAQRLILAQDYILRTKVTVGYDGDAVTAAERVTIVGPVAPQVIQALAAAHTPVQRVSGDLDKIRQELEALQ